jgi:hypothetical protein
MKFSYFLFKYNLIAVLLFACGPYLKAQPIITSLDPYASAVGSTITINGSGFSTTASTNIVWFGSARAVVANATATSLSVTVPTGFRPGRVSATTGGLTGKSNNHFKVTFPGAVAIVSGAFQPYSTISSPASYSIATGDLDGDGKPEIILNNDSTANVSVLKNTSDNSNVDFSTRADFPISSAGGDLSITDIDGDGRLDIVASSITFPNRGINILLNTSSGGSISFAPNVFYFIGGTPYQITAGDIDGDGKADLVTSNGWDLVTYANNSTVGSVSFSQGVGWLAGQYPKRVVIVDLNSDGKPEVCAALEASRVSVLPNNSVPGSITLGTAQTFSAGTLAMDLAVGDLDNDGKPDLVTGNRGNSTVSILKNTTVGNTITMSPAQNLPVSSNLRDLELADINGDGLLDIVLGGTTTQVSILPNTSSDGNLSFGGRINYLTLDNLFGLAIADLRNTGRLDIAVLHRYNNKLSVLLNKITEPPVINSFTPSTGSEGTTVNVKGRNLSGVTAVTFGGTPVVSYTVINDTLIKAIVGAGATGPVVVTAPSGNGNLAGFLFVERPKLTSFAPVAAHAGNIITINGSGFSTIPTENFVYFGGAVATVNSASPTQLLVTVPSGAMYSPISVTKEGQTSYSNQNFNLLFDNGVLSSGTLRKSYESERYLVSPHDLALADIDRDGRTDMITANLSGNNVYIYPNTSQNGIVSFGTPISFHTTAQHAVHVTVSDVDGDGKLDLVVACEWSGGVAILRNKSTIGNFAFDPAFFILVGSYPSHVAMGDLDGDGRPDMAVACNSGNYITVLRNISSAAGLGFSGHKYYMPAVRNHCTVIDDIDGDGKLDILATNEIDSSFAFFRNTSVVGSISSAPRVDFKIGRPPDYITTADFDQDGKKDIIVGTSSYSTALRDTAIQIYRNISTPGNLLLAPKQEIFTKFTYKIAAGDMDGDGWADMVVSVVDEEGDYDMTIYKNNSTGGEISFGPGLLNVYDPSNVSSGFDIGDLDGDAIPDVGSMYHVGDRVTAFINQNGPLVEMCPNSTYSIHSNISGNSYRWQVMRPDSAYRNLANDGIHSGVTTPILTFNNLPTAWTGSKYRCIVNTGTSKVFTVKFLNRWTGIVSSFWENPNNWSCNVVPDHNTTVIISAGTVVLHTSTTIHSLILSPGVNLTINPGVNLTVIH